MFLQPFPTEAEISALPLDFLLLTSEYERETFTDQLISIWIELAESGSLATLPPVPDIVDFADNCAAFFLVRHTDMGSLNRPPRSSNSPDSSATGSTNLPKRGSPSKSDKRWRPYPHPVSKSNSDNGSGWDRDIFSDGFEADTTPKHRSNEKHQVEPITGVIGCVYLSFSPFAQSTADIGIVLRPNARGRGYGRASVAKILQFAFENIKVHRVVASVFGPSTTQPKEGAKESGAVRWIFEKMGFTPEGVHRRAGFSPTDGVWRDVYTLAMLDTDWMLMQSRKTGRECITSAWDTMIERHEKEREQMMEWMEDPGWGKLKRTASTETIKGMTGPGLVNAQNELDHLSKGKERQREEEDMDALSEAEFDTTSFNLWPSADEVPSFNPEAIIPQPTINDPFSAILDSHSYTEGSPAPPSSIGISPPASVISLSSDYEWRSSTASSHPSVESSPSLLAPSYRSPSPPVLALDIGADYMAAEPIDFWASDSDFDTNHSVSSPAPSEVSIALDSVQASNPQ